jgi:hypothetical protein
MSRQELSASCLGKLPFISKVKVFLRVFFAQPMQNAFFGATMKSLAGILWHNAHF